MTVPGGFMTNPRLSSAEWACFSRGAVHLFSYPWGEWAVASDPVGWMPGLWPSAEMALHSNALLVGIS